MSGTSPLYTVDEMIHALKVAEPTLLIVDNSPSLQLPKLHRKFGCHKLNIYL
jgi:hypothetical protein